MRKKIIHCFQWKLQDIINNLVKIKTQGFDMIQISPIQPCKTGDEWWKLYQPFGFKIGNKKGTKEDLIKLCQKANELNLDIICDVVLNHMAGKDNGEIKPHDYVDIELTHDKDFWKYFKPITNWNDRSQVINFSCGLPSLNLANHKLQKIIIDFLNEVIECGVKGFRFDSAKNIALPEEGNNFWVEIFKNLNNKENLFNYAEIIFENNQLINNYLKYINVLTNSYEGCNKSKIVTFFMSHDTELEFKYTKKLNDEDIVNEWGVLLKNNKESHMLFYCRPWSDLWKDERIKKINLEK